MRYFRRMDKVGTSLIRSPRVAEPFHQNLSYNVEYHDGFILCRIDMDQIDSSLLP